MALLLLAGCADVTRPTATGSAPSLFTATVAPPSSDADASTPLRTDAPAVAAAALAVQAMAKFVPTAGESPEEWFAGLAPLLSPQARQAYAGTDPANVRVHTLLGPPTVDPSSTADLTIVDIATDGGPYQVLCSRTDTGQWQVERIVPAGSR